MTHPKSNPLRRPGAWLLAGSMLALSLTACLGGGGGNGSDPDGELCPASASAGSFDSLHAPLCVLLDTGAVLYEGNCQGCHQPGGVGSAGGIPPHANVDFVQQATNRHLIEILLNGYSDSILANGLWYTGTMPAFSELTNFEAASLLSYIRVQLNDSTVVSCDTTQIDELGFAKCQKTPRSVATRKADSVSVLEVKAVRDSLASLPPG